MRALTLRKMPAIKFKDTVDYMKVLRENILILFVLRFLNSSEAIYFEVKQDSSNSRTDRFQARIGNMDGIFVAYHNTAKIFGFQYVPLCEIDNRLFGSSVSGDRVFRKCVELLEAVSDEIVACFSGEVRCIYTTCKQGYMEA
jgi:hypothetical protein